MEKQRTELDILNEQLIIKIHENRIYLQERKELNEKVLIYNYIIRLYTNNKILKN